MLPSRQNDVRRSLVLITLLTTAAGVVGCGGCEDRRTPGAWPFREPRVDTADDSPSDAAAARDTRDTSSEETSVFDTGGTGDADTAGSSPCPNRNVFPAERPTSDDGPPSGDDDPLEVAWKTTLSEVTPHDEDQFDYGEVDGMAFAEDFVVGDDRSDDTLLVRTANPDRPDGVPGYARNLYFDFTDPGARTSWSQSHDESPVLSHPLPPPQVVGARQMHVSPVAVEVGESLPGPAGRFVDLDGYKSGEDGRGSFHELIGPLPETGVHHVSHSAVFPGGPIAVLWADRRVLAVTPDQLNKGDGYPDYRISPRWSVTLEELWPDAPEKTRLDWMRAVGPRHLLVRARPSADPETPDRLYRIDPCRPEAAREVARAVGIGPEVLKLDDGYLTRVGSREAGPAGSEPVVFSDGRVVARLGERCRGLVQSADDQFVCARSFADSPGLTWLRFDSSLDNPHVEGLGSTSVIRSRLQLVAEPGPAMVFLGVRRGDETARAVVHVRYNFGWRHLTLSATETALGGNAELPTFDGRPAVMTESGELLFSVTARGQHWFFGVRTGLDGLAPTPYPRVRYGGNHNRGWTGVSDR